MENRKLCTLFAFGVLILMVAILSSEREVPTFAQPVPSNKQTDVTYCNVDGVDLKMDLYYPSTGKAPVPVVLYVHSGIWTSGSKLESMEDDGFVPQELTERGYMVVAIDYRLAPQHHWPAQIEDVKCAVRHLRANASKYNLDPGRIGVWGVSVGGQLASLLATTDPGDGFDGTSDNLNQSSRVQAVVDIAGPTDLTAFNISSTTRDFAERILGKPLKEAADDLRNGSPIFHISDDDPPFLIIHGKEDPFVPLDQSQQFSNKLKEAGVPVQLVMVRNAGQIPFKPGGGFKPVGGPISPNLPQIRKQAYNFLDKYLRNINIPLTNLYFPLTGKTMSGKFLQYWKMHGGLDQYGYPISERIQEKSDTDGKTYTMQYFQRTVFELHPENQSPHDVLISLLGVFAYAQKYPSGTSGQALPPNASPDSQFFKETGRTVSGRFLEYWKQNGGLTQQGYPISEVFSETSDLDGTIYQVQYFERAMFELHPENQPTHDVLLSLLGTSRYKSKYGIRNRKLGVSSESTYHSLGAESAKYVKFVGRLR